MNYVLAFVGGAMGAAISGTVGFIVAGALGITATVLSAFGTAIPFMTDILQGILFFPPVVFNGGAVSVAYAATRHKIQGNNPSLSVVPTKDVTTLLVGGCAGLMGYAIAQLPMGFLDGGALAVVGVNLLGRLLFGGATVFTKTHLAKALPTLHKILAKDLLLSVPVAVAAAVVAQTTGVLSLPFSCSAFSVILSYFIKGFTPTHHISMCAAYGTLLTGFWWFGILLGIIAHVVFRLFSLGCNTRQKTHLDEPAFAILVVSLPLLAMQ